MVEIELQEHQEFSERLKRTEEEWQRGMEEAKGAAAAAMEQQATRTASVKQEVETARAELARLTAELSSSRSAKQDLETQYNALKAERAAAGQQTSEEMRTLHATYKRQMETQQEQQRSERARIEQQLQEAQTQCKALQQAEQTATREVRGVSL